MCVCVCVQTLSPTEVAGSSGVMNSWRLSPTGQYVLFQGDFARVGNVTLWSTPVDGGRSPSEIGPALGPNSQSVASAFSIHFRPSALPVFPSLATAPLVDTQLLVVGPTNAGTVGTSDSDEVWVTGVYGGDLKKLSPYAASPGQNKQVLLLTYTRDWVLLTANDGVSTSSPSSDARKVYLTNWAGTQISVLSPSVTQATSQSPLLSCLVRPSVRESVRGKTHSFAGAVGRRLVRHHFLAQLSFHSSARQCGE